MGVQFTKTDLVMFKPDNCKQKPAELFLLLTISFEIIEYTLPALLLQFR